MCERLVVVQSDDAAEFQKAFNSKMSELEGKDPKYEFNHAQGFCAYIIYSDKSDFNGIVKPANRCICDTCMRCQEPPRPHALWRKCDIYGSVKRDTECKHYLPGGGWDAN